MISTQELVKRILADQRERCQRGEAFRVETYLEQQPALRADADAVLDLIYHEMVLRETQGEAPTLQEYLARFPEWAEQLERQWEIERALQPDNLTETQCEPSFDKTAAAGFARRAGNDDYEILEVLGQGGMGAVYKARQRSLNRIVALKMIRDGSLASADDRERFRIEAEAAARLQHPNIVQIFEVGERDSMPFLALEYVAGGSLARKLHGRPWPPRQAAGLVETLARAIHYAHEQGIVHRDLKPANILLTVDEDTGRQGDRETSRQGEESGEGDKGTGGLKDKKTMRPGENKRPRVLVSLSVSPKIADFGLAKIMREDGSGMTQTGTFLGTPSYAAPEQVAGRIHELGPRTDVYSLGAILYELLSGRPPFQGASVLETLDQVRSQEPVPPSRLGNKLPRDLETICLKCLQKDQRKRYASAAFLADDLGRFQQGHAIVARPVGRVERLYKLARRKPAATMAVVAVVVLAIVGWVSAITQQGLRRQAEANLARALEAVDAMLTRVADVDLADVPQMEPVRKKLLEEARTFLESFLKERGDDPTVRFLAAKAYSRLGDIQGLMEEYGAAQESYGNALTLLRKMDRGPAETRQELARSLDHVGVLLKSLDRLDEAKQSLEESVDLRQELVEEFVGPPEFQRDLANALHDLATVFARRPEQRATAREMYERALAWQEKLANAHPDQPDYRRDQARTLNDLGNLLWTVKFPITSLSFDTSRTGSPDTNIRWTAKMSSADKAQLKAAEKPFLQAIQLEEKLVENYPDVPTYRRDLAQTWNNLGGCLYSAGRYAEATKTYRESLELTRRLANDFPKVPIYRQGLAATYGNLGTSLEDLARSAEAEDAYRTALALRLQLARDFRGKPEHRHKLALAHCDLGSLLSITHGLLEAEIHLRKAVHILKELAHGGGALYQSDLGWAYHCLGQAMGLQATAVEHRDAVEIVLQGCGHPLNHAALLLRRRCALFEARDSFQKALLCQKSARAADPAQHWYKARLRLHSHYLAHVCVRLEDHEEAARAAQLLPFYSLGGTADYILGASFLTRCIVLAQKDLRLPSQERHARADFYAEQAIALLHSAVDRGFQNLQSLKTADFAPLRDRRRFHEVLQKLEKGKKQGG